MGFLYDIRYGLSVMGTCWVGYWAHMYGYSVVEGDSCKTALSWVVVRNIVVLRRLWIFLSVTG